MVAFGNPGGCVSKSLGKRIDKWHEKLSDLSKQKERLKTHILILKGAPLTSRIKRDYIYSSNWGVGLEPKEIEGRFERALQDAPRYVQKAYHKQLRRGRR